jgi:hypothetical protein
VKNKKLWLAGIAIVIILLLFLRPFPGMSLDPFAIVAKVTVVDEDGKPVDGAETDLLTYKPIKNMALSREVRQCLSDTKGKAILTGHWGDFSMGVLISASKPGYYASGMEVHPLNGSTYWRPEVKLVLRKRKNPVPMYVKDESIDKPIGSLIFRDSIGYDLMKGDLVKPHGKGEVADFIFHVQRQEIDAKNFSAEATLTFSNPDDGIMFYPLPKDMQSVFIFPQEAPLDGYKNQFFVGRHVSKGEFTSQFMKTANGELKSYYLTDENLHYIFRVRTVRDKDGKIISACYGKIRQQMLFITGVQRERVDFLYYFNPDPTSRSLEFAPGKNLFKEGGYDGDSP